MMMKCVGKILAGIGALSIMAIAPVDAGAVTYQYDLLNSTGNNFGLGRK